MKRQDREGSPRGNKRSRPSGYGPPDIGMVRERMSPDFDRRSGRKFMGEGPPREGKPFRDYDDMEPPRKHFRDDYNMPPMRRAGSGDGDNDYRSLIVTSLPSKLPDAAVKDALLHEFWKYGEMNVKVTFSGDQRVAYLNFRYPEDARAAKHKGRDDIFERPLRIEPVYNKRRSGSPGDFNNRDHFNFHNRRNSPPPYRPPPMPPEMPRGPVVTGRPGPPPGPPPGMAGGGGPPFSPDHPMMFSGPPPGPITPGMMEESRRNDKFPYHLDHIDPEFDEKATRTLFVGNLDVNISDMELRHIFEKYGFVEDIDIKRPQKGQGNAFAFIKFVNLDCAHRAKVEMSGKYIGKFQCKIGYGKVTPTTCLWVGGIGPWLSRETLEQEFDRFGAIQRTEWPAGKTFAYVLYDSIDAAKAACLEMRGVPLGGPDRRLRVDFADIAHISNPVFHGGPPPRPFIVPEREFERSVSWTNPATGNGQMDRGGGGGGGGVVVGGPRREEWFPDREPPGYRHNRGDHMPEMDRRREPPWPTYPNEGDRRPPRRPRSPGNYGAPPYDGRSRSPDRRDFHPDRPPPRDDRVMRADIGGADRERRGEDKASRMVDDDPVNHIRSVNELAKNLPVAWNGALILKNSAFAARMHVVSGDVTIVDNLMRDPTTTEAPVLRITQRLRLDQPKLEDVGRRISSAGRHGHCILLAMPSTLQNYDEHVGVAQQRPLKNLVSYLKQKDAAGVISLPPNPTSDKNVGVLHAFPPCQFGYNFLLKRSPKLPPEFSALKEDYLVVVVVVGAH